MRQGLGRLLLATCYAVALYFLRDLSSAHWYLPAGLRFGALLIAPTRFWPYIYAGECASLLVIRIPLIEQRGLPWVLVSTLTALPPVAAVVYFFRRRTALPAVGSGSDILAMLMAAGIVSVLTTAINAATTYGLMVGRPTNPVFYVLGIWVLGQYLGILMFSSVALFWHNRNPKFRMPYALWPEAMGAIALMIVGVVTYSQVPDSARDGLAHLVRGVVGIAAFVLTYRHGWRGGAMGVVALILAVGLTAGPDYDPSTLAAQQVVAFIASSLVAAGAVMTHNYEIAVGESLSRRRAEDAGRQVWEDSEAQNLEHIARAQVAYTQIMRESDSIIGSLRLAKRSEDIMRLTSDLMASTRSATASLMHEIYPEIVFTVDGLYGALRARRISGVGRIRTSLTGNPIVLSRPTALNIYRAAGAAMDHLSSLEPKSMSLKVRVGRAGGTPGAYIYVRADITTGRSNSGTAAIARLRRRVAALGGLMRNGTGEVAILLPDLESVSVDDIPQVNSPSTPGRPIDFA